MNKFLSLATVAIFSLPLMAQTNIQTTQNPDQTVNGRTEYQTSDQEVNKIQTNEQIGQRQAIQNQNQDAKAQLQQARENVKIDEQNIQKAEARKDADEDQVDVDEKSVKKFKAQLEEDKAQVDKLEDKSGVKKKSVFKF